VNVHVTVADNTVTLTAPYNPDLPARARALGGKFERATKAWRFDARDEGRVRELARDIYGTDGRPAETVTVRVHLVNWHRENTIYLFGREIATRRTRDSPVQLGQGVVLIQGGFASRGGSGTYPELEPEPGTVVEVRDVPAGHSDITDDITIVDTVIDQAALRAERERLVARLAEIDALLDAGNHQ
jgi:hypothetical protein